MVSETLASEFSFVVPQCAPGVTLRVTAPDGVVLMLPLPAGVEEGDEMHLARSDEGKWGFKQLVKGAAAPPQEAAIPTRSQADLENDLAASDVVTVSLETTKGPIHLKVVPSWSPLGAERFLQLVEDGYYKEVAIYRGVPNCLLQFGVVKDAERNGKYSKIPDDPLCGVPYVDGMVGFAASGPGTRTSTLCLFLGDMPYLGKNSVETPIGKVCPASMATLHELFCPGDIPQCGGKGPDPDKLEELGNEYIASNFPECDFVTGAARVS